MTTVATTRLGRRWIGLFGLAWMGIWLGQLTPFQLTLPEQVNNALHLADDQWQRSVVAFGIISGISAICALVVFPLTGSLSDRTPGSLGRRRPWIVAGIAVFAVGIAVLGTCTGLVGITIWWCIALSGFSCASAALTALISDQVPVDQRGVVSSWIAAPQAIGIMLGVALLAALSLDSATGNAVVAALLLACSIPFVCYMVDPPVTQDGHTRLSAHAVISELWVSPREHPDFGWTLLGRVLVNLANALGTSLLLYFLQFGLHVSDAETGLLVLIVVYMVFVVGSALITGLWSDRIGRRQPFVLASGVLQAIAALIIGLVASFPSTVVSAALLGAAFGSFLGVDQALATQVLPDPDHTGKDVGIMNIAMAVPQALGPLVGAGIVIATGGFVALFTVSAVLGIAGGVSVLRVRSVR